jgi:hypothetical protein
MQESVDWLLRNAGPSIRYRVLVDLVKEQDVGVVGRALKDMLGSSLVENLLLRLIPDFGFDAIHSGNPDAYENVMGKLVMLGVRAGLQPFDSKTIAWRTWLVDNAPSSEPHSVFLHTVIASFLSYAGYGNTSPVEKVLKDRLDALYTFAKKPDFSNIYVDKSQYKGIPKAPYAQKAPLVNPKLYPDQQFMLPWLHDIRGIASCSSIMTDVALRKKAEEVVRMILTEEYQKLPRGYGLGKYGNRYYMIGWSMKLQGYQEEREEKFIGSLLLNLEMLARFKNARKSEWFVQCLEYLEKFSNDSGTYLFPRAGLPEQKLGYWVRGNKMGIEENRRPKLAIECESTFWMLWIKHLSQDS